MTLMVILYRDEPLLSSITVSGQGNRKGEWGWRNGDLAVALFVRLHTRPFLL